MDSETDFSSDSNYDEFANEIPFVGDILQLFKFEPINIQAKKHLACTNASGSDWFHNRT